ncbi:AglQ family protein [Halalkaliarchaeum desulfuricum]|uniref:AglQ family protein n=1 Tax=Halalkaliarchaeum desulfuricum TaxID=2055893 RepID=A0A343TN61_9EURY|nr:hypothetical protein [Halalkaliarchaeum desulfuricum]AUX10533.1 AglQ family protein [Halalkaliarchaeum desulfuricum]
MSECESGEVEFVTIHELLERSAESALELQRNDGSFPPGNNGPYQDDSTPVRNTANWLKILSFVYEQTGKRKFKQASNSAVEYLKQDELRPYGYTYICRRSNKKDSCNGVVGQANVIEAMGRAGNYLDKPELYDFAAQIYNLHPFNKNIGVWNRREIDGTILTTDRTFNHQLIFATASSLISDLNDRNEMHREISVFLNNLSQNMGYDSSGLIIHRLRPTIGLFDIVSILRDKSPELFLNQILHTKRRILQDKDVKSKEQGYQSVNLYWLANLKRRRPEHDIWSDLPINKLINVTRTTEYRSQAKQSVNWFSNMPPGFEIAHALNTFDQDPDYNEMRYWIEMALNNHYDKKTNQFVKNCDDPDTLNALLYKLIDLPNLSVRL